jgi:RNA recognition motif-containing protein
VFNLFKTYGKIVSAKLETYPNSKESRGLAYIQFEDVAHAEAAIEALNGKDFKGKQLEIFKLNKKDKKKAEKQLAANANVQGEEEKKASEEVVTPSEVTQGAEQAEATPEGGEAKPEGEKKPKKQYREKQEKKPKEKYVFRKKEVQSTPQADATPSDVQRVNSDMPAVQQ